MNYSFIFLVDQFLKWTCEKSRKWDVNDILYQKFLLPSLYEVCSESNVSSWISGILDVISGSLDVNWHTTKASRYGLKYTEDNLSLYIHQPLRSGRIWHKVNF